MKSKWAQETQDTRFVPEVQLTTKVAYVSVEVPTKGQVSFNPKPCQTITKIKFSFPLSNPREGEDNTNFSRLTTILMAPRWHLVRLGDKSPRVMNTRRSLVKCFCLKIERVTQELTQISSRRLEFDWSLREREFELKKLRFKGFSSQWSGQMSGEGGDHLLFPP
jgi:hypothetical protein